MVNTKAYIILLLCYRLHLLKWIDKYLEAHKTNYAILHSLFIDKLIHKRKHLFLSL